MVTSVIKVKNETGLHARPASMFVKLAKNFDATVEVKKGEKKINGKSMLGLLSMSIVQGDEIELIIDGDDEGSALETLEELFSKDLVD
ncbi:MAG TPA: HPr family phosphocarrier protein [Clostridia bacterium]|nr:HPr family phosphocarrier protein [Clostridia bacterium]